MIRIIIEINSEKNSNKQYNSNITIAQITYLNKINYEIKFDD